MKKTVLILGAIAAFASVQAHAGTMVQDTDGNGTYSMEEMVATYADLSEETFKAIDTDADGQVSAEEMAAAKEAGLIEG